MLVPFDVLMEHEVVIEHRARGKRFQWGDGEIDTLSSDFSVSNEVVLRRLLIFGLTSERFYQSKRKEYLERWEMLKSSPLPHEIKAVGKTICKDCFQCIL
jgi:septin family protein